MILPNIKLDYKAIIITALIGAGAVWLVKSSIGSVVDVFYDEETGNVKAPDILNPASKHNLVHQIFQNAYTAITGSTDTLGEDIYDLTH